MNFVLIAFVGALAMAQAAVDPADVSYVMHTRTHPLGIDFLVDNVTSLEATGYDALKPTRILIHGWLNSRISMLSEKAVPAYLVNGDFNVVVVDWGLIAQNINYVQAVADVEEVGIIVSEMVEFLRWHAGTATLPSMTIVGHSLGAHVAGFAGRNLSPLVENLVSLDPANPMFEGVLILPTPVNAADAQYVQSIHTNVGALGKLAPIGHSTFYANFYELSQPGCGLDLGFVCSHHRAVEYFAESINTNNFLAKECSSFNNLFTGLCRYALSSGTKQYMGGEPLNTAAAGVYYLTTNSASIFSKGLAGST